MHIPATRSVDADSQRRRVLGVDGEIFASAVLLAAAEHEARIARTRIPEGKKEDWTSGEETLSQLGLVD
jgi:hypothetical protein